MTDNLPTDPIKRGAVLLKRDLDSRLALFQDLLGPRMKDPKQFIRQVMMACQKQPDLLIKCDPGSVLLSVAQAAELGVSVSGGPGTQAYLVPYGGTCTLIVSARGLVDIALASGRVLAIQRGTVYKGDEIADVRGTESVFRHVPRHESEEDADIVGAYAIATLKDGGKVWAYLSRAQIDRRRNASKVKSASGPWALWYGPMAEKTAVKALWSMLPQTPEMEMAEGLDTAGEIGERYRSGRAAEVLDITPEAPAQIGPAPEALIKEATDLRTNQPKIWAQVAGSSGLAINCDIRTLEAETLDYLIKAIKAEIPK